MTAEDYTAVVLVVDRSGSMQRIAATVEDALKEFVNKQVQEPGRLTIDTVFFDDQVENRASFVDPKHDELDLRVQPRGMTALFDAVGTKIDSFGQALGDLDESERPGHVIFVIATDGLENSSTEYTSEVIAEKIKHQREVYAWDFTFIGANQDAVLTAQALNIPQSSAITFHASDAGASNVINSMSGYVASARAGGFAGYTAEDRAAATSEDAKADVDELLNFPVRLAEGIRSTASKGGEGKTSAAFLNAVQSDPSLIVVGSVGSGETAVGSDAAAAKKVDFSAKIVAEMLGVTDRKLSTLVSKGELYCYKDKGRRFFPAWQFVGNAPLSDLKEKLAGVPEDATPDEVRKAVIGE